MRELIKSIPLVVWLYRKMNSTLGYVRYLREYRRFQALNAGPKKRFSLRWRDCFPITGEWIAGHDFDRHYVYHPAWACRIVAKIKPEYHVDVSSTLHFCTMLSAFIPVHYYEFRKIDLQLGNMTCDVGNLLNLPLPDASVRSLSCMHVVEHVGLGRYNDPLDPDGDRKAIQELKRVLAVGGSLLFVVPTGKARLMFNAHRIYSYSQVLELFDGLELKEFSLVPDDPGEGGVISHATKELADRQRYGCGCFWFMK